MDKKLEAGTSVAVLLGLNFFLSFRNLTTGIMWFVTAFIGVAAVLLISQLVNENKNFTILRSILFNRSLYSRFGVSKRGKNCVNSAAYGNRYSERELPTGYGSGSYYDGNMQYGI